MSNYEAKFEAAPLPHTPDTGSGLSKELSSLYSNFATIQQQNFQPGKNGTQSDGSIDFAQANSPYGARDANRAATAGDGQQIIAQAFPGNHISVGPGRFGPHVTTNPYREHHEPVPPAHRPPTTTNPYREHHEPVGPAHRPPTTTNPYREHHEPVGPAHRPPTTTNPYREHAEPVGPTHRPPTTTNPYREHAEPVGPTHRPPTTTNPYREHHEPVGPMRRPISTNPYPQQR